MATSRDPDQFRETGGRLGLDCGDVVSDLPDDARSNAPRVYLCDELQEADGLQALLSARGWLAELLPLAELAERVETAPPRAVICDFDAELTLDRIAKIRDLPAGGQIEVLYVTSHRPSQASLTHESSGTFARPLDMAAMVARLDALLTPQSAPSTGVRDPNSTVPPPTAASRPPLGFALDDDPRASSSSPPGSSSGPPPRAVPALDDALSLPPAVPLGFAGEVSRREVLQGEMSPELEALLARAEQRVAGVVTGSIPPPSDRPPVSARLTPEEELENVLPSEVLDALDEPLDLDGDDEAGSEGGSEHGTRSGTGPKTGLGTNVTGPGSYGRAVGSLGTIAGGMTSGVEPSAPPPADDARPPSTRPPLQEPAWPGPANAVVTSIEAPGPSSPPSIDALPPPSPAHLAVTVAPRRPDPVLVITFAQPPPAPVPLPAAPPAASRAAATPEVPAVLGPGDALMALARAVRSRFTGAIAFEDAQGIRRVVLRDGDFVTAASSAKSETLLAFLVERGMLGADVARGLEHKLPPFGRHAGAALIANGHMRQDELWPVLRAHSEWVVGRIMSLQAGGASVERDVPARLQAEPAVFGGATGAEVLVEIGRRVLEPATALARLGGERGRLGSGPNAGLLGECALTELEIAVLGRSHSLTLGEVLGQSPDPAFAAVIAVLVALGVFETMAPSADRAPAEPAERELDALDETAVRARILARRALVDEGDYFALLGLPRASTGYDVRRAYLELRRSFEPSRILTPGSADLREDVDLIVTVLDEAYEILRDNVRRERYRRALESSP